MGDDIDNNSDNNKRKREDDVTNDNNNNNSNITNTNSILVVDDNIDSNNNISSPQSKPRLNINKEAKNDKVVTTGKKGDRWKTHKMTEDYVNLVGDLMYPKTLFGPQGYDIAENRYPIERITTLGYLINPIRKITVIEKWSPIEIAIFEGSITLYGKNFNLIQKYVKTKTVEEVIEFYYDWKKTSHYKQWKKNYVSDPRDCPTSIEKEVAEKEREKERNSRNSQGGRGEVP